MSPPRSSRARALGAVLLATATLVMLRLTWGGWADPLVDFGRELYVPWRLTEGARLYTDIAWFNGPLSQYWNGLWFHLFGPGLHVLVASNAIVLAATLWALDEVVFQMAGRGAATVAGLVFLLVFAFGQYVGIANYNWLAPYSHEVTHGVALALGATVGLARWDRTGSRTAFALSGLALGLCFLTKVEPFLAALGATVVMIAVSRRRPHLLDGAGWLGGAALPIVVSVVLVGPGATVGAWPSVLARDVSRLAFYQVGMGVDLPGLRLEQALTWATMWLLALLIPVGGAWLARETRGPVVPMLAGGATLAGVWWARGSIPWSGMLRPLPLVIVVILAWLIHRHRAERRLSDARERPTASTLVPALGLGTLGLILLAKMILNVRVAHYGFALAAPATLFTVVALVRWLPDRLDAHGFRGDVARGCIVAFVVVFCAAHVERTRSWMSFKTEVVGSGRDTFRADRRGAVVRGAVARLRDPGTASAVVLPEGVMINYLARTPNPTPYLNFMPPEALLYGDPAWVAAFTRSPPDVIVRVPKDTSEYGIGDFGFGFGRGLVAWVRSNYVEERVVTLSGSRARIGVLVPR